MINVTTMRNLFRICCPARISGLVPLLETILPADLIFTGGSKELEN